MEAYLSTFYIWVGWQPMTWFTLFLVATLGDAVTTLYALKRGGYEANPVMRNLMGVLTPPVALFTIKAFGAATLFAAMQFKVLLLPPMALAFVAVCVWNIGQILMLKRHPSP